MPLLIIMTYSRHAGMLMADMMAIYLMMTDK